MRRKTRGPGNVFLRELARSFGVSKMWHFQRKSCLCWSVLVGATKFEALQISRRFECVYMLTTIMQTGTYLSFRAVGFCNLYCAISLSLFLSSRSQKQKKKCLMRFSTGPYLIRFIALKFDRTSSQFHVLCCFYFLSHGKKRTPMLNAESRILWADRDAVLRTCPLVWKKWGPSFPSSLLPVLPSFLSRPACIATYVRLA